jgi:hypothetical protein
MKYATRILVLTLTMLPLLATAQSNSTQKIVAQVPFEFSVGSKIVPSGEWIVQPATMDGRVLVIHNSAASVGLFSPASLVEAKKTAGNYTLVFNRYGNRYFLTGVKIAGTRTSYKLPESKGEAEMRAQNVPATEEILLASLR